jgi:SMI1/KNR4 family protein SUKH-1
MEQSAVEKAILQLSESGLVNLRDLKGCTAEEIAQIENAFQLRLPDVYKELLARMGKAAGQFMIGSDYLFPAPLRLRKEAEALVQQSGARSRLDPDHFVFLGHQGYEFLFFDARDTPDPAVFLLMEGEEPKKVFSHFSEWLLSSVADEIEAFRALRGQR